ncbi:MAG: elongation factor G, partial [Eubacteriales bacterium]|nr:elongation factor G [Eubacteriales bacterium]
VPRLAYVNKMDIMGADFFRAVDMMKQRLKTNAVPIQLPIGKEDWFSGIIDLVTMRATVYGDDMGVDIQDIDIPDDMKELAQTWHDRMVESVAESDDDLTLKFLEGEEITIDELKRAIRKATIACHMTPVCCGSSYKNKGVQKMLDAVVDYMPSPLEVPPINGINPDTEEEDVRHTDDSEPFAALAFKIMTDPFVGKLCFFRVYSGTLDSGSYTLNATKNKRERIGRILQMHANHRAEIDRVYSGDIAAAVGLRDTTTGDTLCDDKHPIILESMEFPEPVIQVAIEPKSKVSQDKMMVALSKLAEEDPTFRTFTDTETGQTLIAGMGELHLDIIVDRLFREFKVEANVGAPQVAYKETIRKAVRSEGRFVRQSGGRGQYGHCVLEIEPLPAGSGYEFVNKIVGGTVPREYIAPIDAGIQEAMGSGVLGGYPVVDLRVTLVDGSYHEVDSSEMAFKIAGSMGFKDGCRKADPVLLEPIMRVDVMAPDDYLGDVMGDISARRGRIEGMEDRNGIKAITTKVPLSQMFGYATALRSRTQGRGTFVMQISHFEEVPKNLMESVLRK